MSYSDSLDSLGPRLTPFPAVRGRVPEYGLEISFCVALTSLVDEAMDDVRSAVLKFPDRMRDLFENAGKKLRYVKARVIAARDEDGAPVIEESPLYTLYDGTDGFAARVNALRTLGDSLDPEIALRTLAQALDRGWVEDVSWEFRPRRVFVLLSNTCLKPTLEPSEGLSSLVRALDERWECPPGSEGEIRGKRLFMFVPACYYPWSAVSCMSDTECIPVPPNLPREWARLTEYFWLIR